VDIVQGDANVPDEQPTAVKGNALPPTIVRPDRLPTFEVDSNILEQNCIVGFNNRDVKSRQFSLLRTQVLKKMQAHNWKIIGVTSPAPGAGKSFLSSNLCASLSRIPNRTIYLFDLDLRRATQAHNFGLSGEYGLSEYLEGTVNSLSQIGRRIDGTNLSIYPCYEPHFDSFERLSGQRFSDLIGAMHRLPDDAIVICDLPPVFANDDAIMVAQKLDAYIMVLEQGVNTQKQIQDCARLLEPTPCLGSVLNRYDGGFSDPYGYGSVKKYTGYYDTPKA